MQNVELSKYYKFVGYSLWANDLNTIVYVTGITNIQESESFEAKIYDTWFSSIPNGSRIFEEMKNRNNKVFICQTIPGYIPLDDQTDTKTIYVPMGILDYMLSDDIKFVERTIINITTTPFIIGEKHNPDNIDFTKVIGDILYRNIGKGSEFNIRKRQEIIPSKEYLFVDTARKDQVKFIQDRDAIDQRKKDEVVSGARQLRYEWERAEDDLDRKRKIIGQEANRNKILYGILKSKESDADNRLVALRNIHTQLLAIDGNIPSWDTLLEEAFNPTVPENN